MFSPNVIFDACRAWALREVVVDGGTWTVRRVRGADPDPLPGALGTLGALRMQGSGGASSEGLLVLVMVGITCSDVAGCRLCIGGYGGEHAGRGAFRSDHGDDGRQVVPEGLVVEPRHARVIRSLRGKRKG
jgi:hypothetical protein